MQLTNVDPSLYNHDLAPIPKEKRSWGTYNYASLWVAMSVCIPTYMLASGLIAGLLLLGWITRKAGGFGPVLHTESKFHSTGEFVRFFIPALTGMVGFWSTVALNIPDFTRYAKSQRAQVVGQALGLPTAMTLYAFIGVAVTSASAVLFGAPIWDPVALLGKFNQPLVAFVALIALMIATLNTNVAANVVSPSNDFSNLRPGLISFRTGGLITGVIGILMMPWKLMTDFSSYIFVWLVGCSAFLGPIAGIMIFDYYLVRRRQLVVEALYRRPGAYEYKSGFDWRALVSLATGAAVALAGFADSFTWLAYCFCLSIR